MLWGFGSSVNFMDSRNSRDSRASRKFCDLDRSEVSGGSSWCEVCPCHYSCRIWCSLRDTDWAWLPKRKYRHLASCLNHPSKACWWIWFLLQRSKACWWLLFLLHRHCHQLNKRGRKLWYIRIWYFILWYIRLYVICIVMSKPSNSGLKTWLILNAVRICQKSSCVTSNPLVRPILRWENRIWGSKWPQSAKSLRNLALNVHFSGFWLFFGVLRRFLCYWVIFLIITAF